MPWAYTTPHEFTDTPLFRTISNLFDSNFEKLYVIYGRINAVEAYLFVSVVYVLVVCRVDVLKRLNRVLTTFRFYAVVKTKRNN